MRLHLGLVIFAETLPRNMITVKSFKEKFIWRLHNATQYTHFTLLWESVVHLLETFLTAAVLAKVK